MPFVGKTQIRILVSILKLPIYYENKKGPLRVKLKNKKNLLEEKLADLVPLSSDKKMKTKTRNSSNLKHVFSLLEEFVSLTSFEENLLHRMSTDFRLQW